MILCSPYAVRCIAKELVTGPAAEPIARTEAKLHCHVDHADEDTYVDGLIVAARETVEQWTGRALVSQVWKAYYPWLGRYLILPRVKATAVAHVKYYDTADAAQTISASIWDASLLTEPGYVTTAYEQAWPTITTRTTIPVEVQFTAGYADAAAVPNSIKQAMMLLIGHWYQNREDVLVGERGQQESAILKTGAFRLLDNYTVKGLE